MNRELVCLLYGAVLGWYLYRWYQAEKERHAWELEAQVRHEVYRQRELDKGPPQGEVPAS